ncbi:DUF5629 family protein [Pseudomonas sp. HR96]|uniref:DUF5629 family protein n=1 Tax=Pseudomonas sp. HR96 TaxID=1027966 RepID=UPI002A75997F|nr:DUF5629 family protein [Pseudomonas sp. HR96]WPO98660.1 DUF5629 family protein [Pseudomonas sp. HR96]
MTASLTTELQTANLLLIDGLHAFDFTLTDAGLTLEAMDGRQLKRWAFSPEQLTAAQRNGAGDGWQLAGPDGTHQLLCLNAFSASDDEDEDSAVDETQTP